MDENEQTNTAPAGSPPATGYVVAGGGKLTVGEEYHVRHERKGSFSMRVTKIDDEWITGTITYGLATAMMSYNIKEVGEEITIRDCHSYFTPVTKTT